MIEASAGDPADVHFDLCDGPSATMPEMAAVDWGTQPIFDTDDGSHRVWCGAGRDGRFWRLWYGSNDSCQAVEFVINPAGRQIWAFRRMWASQREPISIQDITTLLLGAVIGVVLRLRGLICLHASVVALGSRAVVILGHKGAGKSSVAAALAERGHAVLSDDIAVITNCDGACIVHAGYPSLRLWPRTLRALKMQDTELTPVLRLGKRYLELSPAADNARWRFQPKSLPVGAMYLLTRGAELDGPVIQPMAAAERLATLIAQTSVRFLPLDEARRAQEFAQLSRLAKTVPFFRIQCQEGLEHLPSLCEGIENDALNFAFKSRLRTEPIVKVQSA